MGSREKEAPSFRGDARERLPLQVPSLLLTSQMGGSKSASPPLRVSNRVEMRCEPQVLGLHPHQEGAQPHALFL